MQELIEIPVDMMDEEFLSVMAPQDIMDEKEIPQDVMEVQLLDESPLDEIPQDVVEVQPRQKMLKDYRLRGNRDGKKKKQKRDGPSWSSEASGGMRSPCCPDDLMSIPLALDGTLQDDAMEVFSRPRVVPLAAASGLRARMSLDLMNGWDGLQAGGQQWLFEELASRRPKLLILSPPCTYLCQLMGLNWWKMDRQVRETKLQDAIKLLDLAIWAAEFQLRGGRDFLIEHPAHAKTWVRPNVKALCMSEQVMIAPFHQCVYGLQSKVHKIPIKKPTKFCTSMPSIRDEFDHKYCNHMHAEHQSLEGSEGGEPRSHHAQIYPPQLCNAIIAAYKRV